MLLCSVCPIQRWASTSMRWFNPRRVWNRPTNSPRNCGLSHGAEIAHYKVPRLIDFRAELPRLPTGKLYKKPLRQEYLDHLTGD